MIEFSQKLLLKMNKDILMKGHDSSALIKINQAKTELSRGPLVYIFKFPKTSHVVVDYHSWEHTLLPLGGAPYIFINTINWLRTTAVRWLILMVISAYTWQLCEHSTQDVTRCLVF